MTTEEKGHFFFTKYQEAFVLIALTVLLIVNLNLGVKVTLILAISIAVLAIIFYFIHKLTGFLLVSFAVGAAIAGLCENYHIGITWVKGNGKLAIAAVLILLAIIEILYVMLEKVIVEQRHSKIGVIVTLILSAAVSGVGYYLHTSCPKYFSGLHIVALLFMVVFASSIISSMFINGKWTVEHILIVSYVIIFVGVFAIVLSILLEDETFLELIVPDDAITNKQRKKG